MQMLGVLFWAFSVLFCIGACLFALLCSTTKYDTPIFVLCHLFSLDPVRDQLSLLLPHLPEVTTDELLGHIADMDPSRLLVAALHPTRSVDRVAKQAETRHATTNYPADDRTAVYADTHLHWLVGPWHVHPACSIQHGHSESKCSVRVKWVNLQNSTRQSKAKPSWRI